MITYKTTETTTDITVYLGKKMVGTIRRGNLGWCYYPKGWKVGGLPFATLAACKKSLEEP